MVAQSDYCSSLLKEDLLPSGTGSVLAAHVGSCPATGNKERPGKGDEEMLLYALLFLQKVDLQVSIQMIFFF